jgi:hypothetical protein
MHEIFVFMFKKLASSLLLSETLSFDMKLSTRYDILPVVLQF